MNLQYNSAVELVSAFFAWTSWHRLTETNRIKMVPEELLDWKKTLDQIFPHYSLEQAKPLASEFLLLIFSLLKAVVIKSLLTPEELLNWLYHCSGKELAEMVVEGEGFPFSLEEMLKTPEKGKEALKQSHGTVRLGEDERFVDFLGHPDYYKTKLLILLTEFHTLAFAPFQAEITRKMVVFLDSEQKASEKNPQKFLETRLLIKTEGQSEDIPSAIFISYYNFIDCLIQDEPSIAVYGWKNAESVPQPDLEDIYSLLTDDTRRSILKRLAKKAMFSREIAETWNLSPSTVSYHMTRLYMLGLISHRTGPRKRIYHELNKERLNELLELIKFDLIGTDDNAFTINR